MATKAKSDPHPKWFIQALTLSAKAKTIYDQSEKIWDKVSSQLPDLRVQIFEHRQFINSKTEKVVPVYVMSFYEIEQHESSDTAALAKTFGVDHPNVKNVRRFWAKKKREFREIACKRDAILVRSGYRKLECQVEDMQAEAWRLQTKICLTKARTLRGAETQAHTIQMMTKHGKPTKNQDAIGLRNLADTLSDLLKVAQMPSRTQLHA